jgi:hypothetical protein
MFVLVKQRILQNLWKLLVVSPISWFGVVSGEIYISVGGIRIELSITNTRSAIG